MPQSFRDFPTAQEIYTQLVDGPGSKSLAEAQRIACREQENESMRADLVMKLSHEIRTGWQGASSDGAYGAARPLADAAIYGSDQLDRAQDLLDRQSGSYHRAANSVRELPPQPPEDPLAGQRPYMTDHEREVRAYQADEEHNLEVFRNYDNESSYNETNMPTEYTSVAYSGGGVSVKTPDAGDSAPPGSEATDESGRNERGGGTGSGGGGAPGGGYGGGPGGSGPAPQPGPGSSGPSAGGQQPPQQTSPNDFRPPVDLPGYQPGSPSVQQPAANVGGPVGSPGGFVGGSPGGGSPGGGGSGSGGGGRGGGFGGGPGGRVPGPGFSPGPGSGVGAGAPVGEGAARPGAVAAGGRAGATGPMGAPMGGGGQRKDDEEHERKVLIDPDPEEMFGSDVLTAPQVIGDDEYEDD